MGLLYIIWNSLLYKQCFATIYCTLGARGFFLFCFAVTVSGEAAIVNKRKKNPLVKAGLNLTSMLIRDKTVCQTGFIWDLFVFIIWHVCAWHSIMGVTGLHDSYVCDICTFAVYNILCWIRYFDPFAFHLFLKGTTCDNIWRQYKLNRAVRLICGLANV